MVRILSLFLFAGILIATFFSFQASAFALPYAYGLYEKTKECAVFNGGDECESCGAPEGWILKGEITGLPNEFQCPVGYKLVYIDSICTPIISEFCCSPNHSGSRGCDHMISQYSSFLFFIFLAVVVVLVLFWFFKKRKKR
jgi:hypothetical protein